MHQVFNKQFEHIDVLCDTDVSFEAHAAPSQQIDHVVFKNLRTKDMKSIKLYEPREKIRDEVILESVYDETGVERLNEILDDQERIAAKGLISIFGYKQFQ